MLYIQSSEYDDLLENRIKIPPNVIRLVITSYDKPLPYVPDSIKELYMCAGYNHVLPKLPQTLRKLNPGFEFNQSLDNIPDSIEELIISESFTQPINKLPSNLKVLKIFADSVNITCSFPESTN